MMYDIKKATVEDLTDILAFIIDYFDEGAYKNLTFDPDKTRDTFKMMLTTPEHFTIFLAIHRETGNIAGLHSFSFNRMYTVETICTSHLLYICRKHRKFECANKLLEVSDEYCNNNGVGLTYASSTGGFDDGGVNRRAFGLYMKRHGYEEFGINFRKVNKNGQCI